MTRQRLPRLPFILLGAMTAAVLGGPLGIGAVLRGGASPAWPPDRPIEWATVLGISGTVLALMIGCLSLAFSHRKAAIPPRPPPAAGPEDRP